VSHPLPLGPAYKDLSIRTHLKNVFWPNTFVGASFQILDPPQADCGLKLGPAAILNQNPIFEMGSRIQFAFISLI